MNDARLNNWLEVVIIVLLAVDVALEWKMVYGCYPWEARGDTK
jgi:hypothetical protein